MIAKRLSKKEAKRWLKKLDREALHAKEQDKLRRSSNKEDF